MHPREGGLQLRQAVDDLGVVQQHADDPGGGSITSRWRQSKRLPMAEAHLRAASAPGLPVKELGAAGR